MQRNQLSFESDERSPSEEELWLIEAVRKMRPGTLAAFLHQISCMIECSQIGDVPTVAYSSWERKSYTDSPEWAARKKVVFKYYDGKCALCSGIFGLQVHHRTYEHIGNEPLRDLVLLCRVCHSRHHGFLVAPDPADTHAASLAPAA